MQTEQVDRQRIASFLSGASLCEGLAASDLAEMAGDLCWRTFAADETLASPGDRVTEFWVVVEGEVEAFLADRHGRESSLGLVGPGETIGELAILENTARPVRFTARTRGALLSASAETFQAWLDAHPPLVRNLFRTLRTRFKRVLGVADRQLPARRLGIVAASMRGRRLAGRLAARLIDTAERLRVWADTPTLLREGGSWPESLPIEGMSQGGDAVSPLDASAFDRQVIVWSPRADTPIDPRTLLACDEVLWLLEPREAHVSGDLHRVFDGAGSLADKVRIVWLLNESEPVAPLLLGRTFTKPALKVHVESNGGSLTRLERQGLDRLVHALQGYSIGIALAGGGAKGMAHLGVLRVLEQAGISFDAMSGTSAGAMAGLTYAAGMSPELAIESFQRDLTPPRSFRMLPKWPNWYLFAQFRRRAWEAKLRKYLHHWRLEQLPIPFHSVTVDLVQVRPVVRSEGDAVHAILESINLPVISPPILRDGSVLVDGGVLNNLPADVLTDRGIDFVIGVDVSRRIAYEFGGNRPDTPTGSMKQVSALDAMFRVFEAQAHDIGNIRNRAVDFWITPDTSPFSLAEFHRTREIAAAGEVAAEAKLAELMERLNELRKRLLGPSRTS